MNSNFDVCILGMGATGYETVSYCVSKGLRVGVTDSRDLPPTWIRLKSELEESKRTGDLERAGELTYSVIPKLETEIKEAEKRSLNAKQINSERVSEDHIANVVAKWSGIPVEKLLGSEKSKLMDMEELLSKSVIGQKEPVECVSKAIRRAKAGLSDLKRPLASFLFLGPTGVGKTELSKALSEFLFQDREAMTRVDMSEYMEKHSVARLIGSPPGYVGFEEGGALTEAVRRKPYQVVLFDEVEKAHNDVLNLLLQGISMFFLQFCKTNICFNFDAVLSILIN